MLLSEINAVFSLWDRAKKWLHGRKNPPVESVVTRLVSLFESHGVHRNQIPRFFGHDLTLKDVQDDDSFIAKLDEPILQEICERFAVRREWLDGAESQIYPCHDFYKYPNSFSEFIKNLKVNNLDADLHGVLIAPKELRDAFALIILQETIGFVGDKPIYRYHLCNNWVFTYWKARAYLTACVAIAWKEHSFIHGVYMPRKEIERLSEGEVLLGWQGEGIWKLGVRSWYPEDMALCPMGFLEGIDSEQDNFGIKSGLGLWLDLEKDGFMNAGIKENARQLFQQELAKY